MDAKSNSYNIIAEPSANPIRRFLIRTPRAKWGSATKKRLSRPNGGARELIVDKFLSHEIN
jgi:hypothetical protein